MEDERETDRVRKSKRARAGNHFILLFSSRRDKKMKTKPERERDAEGEREGK